MESTEFKTIMQEVVDKCFPEESIVFAECGDAVIDEVFAGRDVGTTAGVAGEFAWADELKMGLTIGKSAIELIAAVVGLYKIWKSRSERTASQGEESLYESVRSSLIESGVSRQKVDKVASVVAVALARGNVKK